MTEPPNRRASLEQKFPAVYQQLLRVRTIAEKHFRDVCDIEFTVEAGRLFVLNVRPAKRSHVANLRFALQFLAEGLITPQEFLGRISSKDVADLTTSTILNLHSLPLLGSGLPACSGAATGQVVFRVSDDLSLSRARTPFILVKEEISRDDSPAVAAAQGVVTLRGGISSHAALECRPLGKPCVVGYSPKDVNARVHARADSLFREGSWITVNGTTGEVFSGKGKCLARSWQEYPELAALAEIIIKAIITANVPAESTGKVWKIHDFLFHSVSLKRGLTQKRAVVRKSFSSFLMPHEETFRRIRSSLRRLAIQERDNYSEILFSMISWQLRQLSEKVGIGSHYRYFRPLWDPGRMLEEIEPQRTQLVGMEFYDVNRHIPNLIELATITVILELDVTVAHSQWFLDFTNPLGESLVSASESALAYRLYVNDAEVRHQDVPVFYNSLRRRKYTWNLYDRNGTTHAEITACLAAWETKKQTRSPLLPLCFEMGLIRNGQLTQAGSSLLGKHRRKKRYEFIAPNTDD